MRCKNGMPIDLMRGIDFWLGIPLLLALTFLHKLSKLLFPQKTREALPQKILFIKPSELGGIILAYPLMKKISKEFPKAELFFLTFSCNKDVFQPLGVIPEQNVITVNDTSLISFIKDTIKAIVRLRKEDIDVLFDLEFFSRYTAFLSFLSAAKKRIGFHRYQMEGLYRGDLFTHKVQYNPSLHISQIYFSLWPLIKHESKSTPELPRDTNNDEISLPRIKSTPKEKEAARKKLTEMGIPQTSPLYIMHLGEGLIPLREWPLENFTAVARDLLKQKDSYILIVGTGKNSKKAADFCKLLGSKQAADLTDKTSLSELLTLFNMAELLITADSGMPHLASLTNIKQCVLFGPESPRVFAPLSKNAHIFYEGLPCSPCFSIYNHRTSACRDNICLKAITPQSVLQIAKK